MQPSERASVWHAESPRFSTQHPQFKRIKSQGMRALLQVKADSNDLNNKPVIRLHVRRIHVFICIRSAVRSFTIFTTLNSLKVAYNQLPPQQTPCEVGGAERALTELLCKNSSKSTVTSPRSPRWLHVEEKWGIETRSPD